MSIRKEIIPVRWTDAGGDGSITLNSGSPLKSDEIDLTLYDATNIIIAVKTTGGVGHDGTATLIGFSPSRPNGNWATSNTGDPALDVQSAETADEVVKYTYIGLSSMSIPHLQYRAVGGVTIAAILGDTGNAVTVEVALHVIMRN